MDIVFAQAVTKIIELPLETQRAIGETLLDVTTQSDLPVIDFTAEENAMIDEAREKIERGEVIGEKNIKKRFDDMRARPSRHSETPKFARRAA